MFRLFAQYHPALPRNFLWGQTRVFQNSKTFTVNLFLIAGFIVGILYLTIVWIRSAIRCSNHNSIDNILDTEYIVIERKPVLTKINNIYLIIPRDCCKILNSVSVKKIFINSVA